MVSLPTQSNSSVATVFIVDDDPAVRKSLRWLIESVGLPVNAFASGGEFLEQYDARHPGCLVLDVRMPGMSGLELQEQLQLRGRHLPIIIMTAYAEVPMAVRAMKNGAVYFLEKPINDQELLDHIQTAMKEDARWHERAQQTDEVRAHYLRLTKRECQVLREVVEGLSSREIGDKLGVSFKTVEAHRAKIMKKMEAENVPHLIRLYLSIDHPDEPTGNGRPSDEPEASEEE